MGEGQTVSANFLMMSGVLRFGDNLLRNFLLGLFSISSEHGTKRHGSFSRFRERRFGNGRSGRGRRGPRGITLGGTVFGWDPCGSPKGTGQTVFALILGAVLRIL